jgi:phospholipid-translocating ATPase
MIISEVVTLGMYAFSMIFLPEYFGAFVFSYPPYASFPCFSHDCLSFHVVVRAPLVSDLSFVVSVRFGWKVAVIVAISALPLWIIKMIKSRIAPEATTKL